MLKKIKEKIKKILDDEKVNDFLSPISFVLIHGILGLFLLLTLISIIGINFVIVDYIRQSVFFTIIVFLLGSGSAYYLLMDLSDFYNNMRNRK
jgi:hypothetical protein